MGHDNRSKAFYYRPGIVPFPRVPSRRIEMPRMHNGCCMVVDAYGAVFDAGKGESANQPKGGQGQSEQKKSVPIDVMLPLIWLMLKGLTI